MLHFSSDSKFESTIMCSGTKYLDLIFVLLIFLFLMSNDSGDMSLGNTETIASYSQLKEMYCDLSLGKFNF